MQSQSSLSRYRNLYSVDGLAGIVAAGSFSMYVGSHHEFWQQQVNPSLGLANVVSCWIHWLRAFEGVALDAFGLYCLALHNDAYEATFLRFLQWTL